MSAAFRPSMPGTLTSRRTSPTTGQTFRPFTLGRCVSTPGALGVLERARVSPLDLLARHLRGDWGDIHPDDYGLNEQGTRTGARIFSVYKLDAGAEGTPVTVWVITDGDDEDGVRHATTILLPDEY